MNDMTFEQWRREARSRLAEEIWERRKESRKCRDNVLYHTSAIQGVKIIAGGQFFMFLVMLIGPASMAVRAMLLVAAGILLFKLVPYHRERILENEVAGAKFHCCAIGMRRLARHIDSYAGFVVRNVPVYQIINYVRKEKLDLLAGASAFESLYDEYGKPEPEVQRLFKIWTELCDDDA